MKLLIFFTSLVTLFLAIIKLTGIAVVGYCLYYIYTNGLDALLTAIWKGFA